MFEFYYDTSKGIYYDLYYLLYYIFLDFATSGFYFYYIIGIEKS